VDVQLAIDAAEVELDRLVAEEERGADLLVGLSLGHLQRDLKLLRRQLLGLEGLPAGERLAARPQLATRALGPRPRADSLEVLKRPPQLLAERAGGAG
jgi:hypothetical protein